MNLKLNILSLALASVGLLFYGCGESTEAKDKKDSSTKASEEKKTEKENGEIDPDKLTPEQIEANAKIEGKKFWEVKVYPMIEFQCKGCHADPRFKREKDGPLTVYNYDKVVAFLKDGTSVNNALLRKLTGINHEGGNRCTAGIDAEPCSTIVEWYKAEFGDDGAVPAVIENPNEVSSESGAFTRVTALGKVFGWAVDKQNLTTKIEVSIYVDGNKDSGELAKTIIAGESGPDGNHSGDHQFSFELPEKYRDRSVRSLYIYGKIGGVDTLLAGPFAFVAYKYSEAGRTFFEQTVEPKLTACKSCHVVSYAAQFAALISPTPANNGTKTNNELINKPGTRNGTKHGGGNRCGSGSPCVEFEQWWLIEFQQ
jgi:hypothetical protein